MGWFYNLFKDSTDDDFILNPTTEASLIKKITILIVSSHAVFPILTSSLYYMRDRFLPEFSYAFADTLKYQIFFDRYLYLIKQGGVEFADRFFIAYTVFIAAHAIVFCIYIPIGSFFVRRDMKPIKQFTKGMKMRVLMCFFALFLSALFIWLQGIGLNQYGRFRANDSYILIMLIPFSALTGGFCLIATLPMAKTIFVAHDTWRDGTFREVFFSQN